eukprot:3176428-Pyramimonas_sp.AAC.1
MHVPPAPKTAQAGARNRGARARLAQWLDQVQLQTPPSSRPLARAALADGISIGVRGQRGRAGEGVISESHATEEFNDGAGEKTREVPARHQG